MRDGAGRRNNKRRMNPNISAKYFHHTLICGANGIGIRHIVTEIVFPIANPTFATSLSTPFKVRPKRGITSPTCVGLETELLKSHASFKEFFRKERGSKMNFLVYHSLEGNDEHGVEIAPTAHISEIAEKIIE